MNPMSRVALRSPAATGLVLRVEDDPGADDVAAVDDGLEAFTVGAAGQGLPQPFGVFARDPREHGALAAGIHGWTWCG
jgi:hypothetical protein